MIESISDTQRQLTSFKCTGEVIVKELINKLITFYETSPTLYLLMDLTHANLKSGSTEDVREYVEFLKSRRFVRIGGKTAIAVSSDLEYGLSRAFQVFSKIKELVFETQVFRSLEEAENWLLPNSER
jgi:hypothetical protein